MPYTPGYIEGNRLVECEVCGFVYRFKQMRRGISENQKGVIVCPEDFDNPTPIKKMQAQNNFKNILK